MSDKTIIGGVVVLLLAVGIVLFALSSDAPKGGVIDMNTVEARLAQCLKDQGAIFYGAFWCPHCANQKDLFGAAEDLLPYVECSTPDGNAQLQICKDKGVQSYPTWEFADGSRLTGEQSFATLAEKAGCALDENGTPTGTTTEEGVGSPAAGTVEEGSPVIEGVPLEVQ